ncbi:SAM-dependent methyltransferase [Hydrogenovibrio sp. SC-1]|uniref:class I SAM-dependent methyltransferase n=1 Tax=Hydrogenovibrio sp. SC-1 TaxID=2065820 RepID=UPI000C79CB07|nr:class I SAM-dependent methyltransferase [Hydrogenovibrio sp. SC-1]PLA74386.1 SAM-dependent methyltransferase [Hydrogenovibrio sp. SC-1]
MWDQRYSEPEFAYGQKPNDFLVACLDAIPAKSKILCLAEGQGRNAVYLAQQGHEVTAVDQSKVGLQRAEQLATEKGVTIHTVVADLAEFDLGQHQWDAIVSIAAHLPPAIREKVHHQVQAALKPSGEFILEAYSPQHLNLPGIGGPPPHQAELLMSLELLQQELTGLNFEIAHEIERQVEEGQYHSGLSGVVQVLARNP